MGKTLLIELHYLPLVSYFSLLRQYDTVMLEACEHFQKQTLRNRTYILTANGELALTVPILHDAKNIQDIKIDYSQNWLNNHLRGITSAYKHSPYFEYYFPYFEEVYTAQPPFLFDLNKHLLELIMKVLKLPQTIVSTPAFEETYPEEVTDLRTKKQHRKGEEGNPYRQVFGERFTSNLSILDLIFNQGPDAVDFL